MNEEPRIRELYVEYARGDMSFDRLIEISEERIARRAWEHPARATGDAPAPLRPPAP